MKLLCALAAVPAAAVALNAGSPLNRRDANVTGDFIETKAPFENVWADFSEKEYEDLDNFLQKQINKTIPSKYWLSSSSAWLLPPNKTDVLSYLDKKGPKPPRYARVLGSGDCDNREYMVGPFPIGNGTKVVPLDYVNNGNATWNNGYCDGKEEQNVLQAATTMAMPPGATQEPFAAQQVRPTGSGHRAQQNRNRAGQNRHERRDPHDPYEEELGWNKEELPHDKKVPPTAILPDGARFEFDPEQNYVAWMDFTFFVATGPAGISLHDIRFKGERVVYELGMQEALAHYAGPDKEITEASYLDVQVGFTFFNVIPGYDCPSYAAYAHGFCLFEYPIDFPLNRHVSGAFHATKNIAFMLRSISTVGNYDYQTTYEFHYDGSIQVVVRASGYIQGSDYIKNPESWEYGFHIREKLSGAMHDHVLNFKLDMDIMGTKNSILKTEFVPHSQVYEWSEGKVIDTMKVERSYIDNEDQGKFNWAANAAAAYSVVNKDKKNEFGEYPGFRIYPSVGSPIHMTMKRSSVFGDLTNWATHQLYALQHKDSEPMSSYPYSSSYTQKSPIDFNDFFNGESLDQEDVVLYFNLGMHHMPDTYDLPNTIFQGAQSGITIRPQNYLRSENSMSTRHQINIDGETTETYGADKYSGSYDLNKANPPMGPSPN